MVKFKTKIFGLKIKREGMHRLFTHLVLFLVSLVSGLCAKQPNVLLICVDDLRPELSCFGVDYIHSPNIDALGSQGRTFSKHYVQSPTCGASRYTLLTGHYGPSSNSALFERAGAIKRGIEVSESMPAYFKSKGYSTVSIGKVSHHPGGRGGSVWNEDDKKEMPHSWHRHINPSGEWRHPRGWMHGLAHGEIRKRSQDMVVFQSEKGADDIYPDGVVTKAALTEMDQLASSEKPFLLAVGFVRPHLPFGAPAKYMKHYKNISLPEIPHKDIPDWASTFHKSDEFMKYKRWGRDPNKDAEFAIEVRKHYAACISFVDAQIGFLIDRLKENGLDKNTVIVLWGDHGWHLGERGIWGKHALFEESLRSPLIISYPGIEKPGRNSDAIVETVDIFPTLCELLGMEVPSHVHGSSLLKQLENPNAEGDVAIAYWGNSKTIRNARYRLIDHNGGVELYDFDATHPGRDNLASKFPEVVQKLKKEIQIKMIKNPQDKFERLSLVR